MKLEITAHLYIHDSIDVPNPLLKQILEKVNAMSVDLTKLQAAIAAEDTLIDSAVAAINGFPAVVAQAVKDALAANNVADAAAQQAADAAEADVQAKVASLTQALTTNVPNAPSPSP